MEHLHKASGKVFECGALIEVGTNKTYDMTVITYWPSGEKPPELVGYYFGDYDPAATDFYINEWFLESAHNSSWIDILCDAYDIVNSYRITNEDVLDDAARERIHRVRHVFGRILRNALDN